MSPELTSFKNIAIIQTAFLGDVALVLPLAQFLKTENPAAKISLITTPAAASIARCATALDDVIAYDKRGEFAGFSGIKKFAELLKKNEFDCVLAPHRSFRTSLLTRLLKPKFSVGFKNAAGSFLYSETVRHQQHLHEIERNFGLLKAFKNGDYLLKSPIPAVEISLASADIKLVEELLLKNNIRHSDTVIALAPGSVWATKRWRIEHFITLCAELLKSGFKVILTGGREDRELCAEIAGNSNAVNLAGETTLPQTLALFKRISAVVCNDSAPTHLAGLVQCPVITIFGPTSPIFGFAPRGEFDEVIQNENLQCRPCEIHGGKTCPIGTHECMKSIAPQMVLKTVEKVLKRNLRISV
jgi:heptosyltransferase-2